MKKKIIWLNIILYWFLCPISSAINLQTPSVPEKESETLIARPGRGGRGGGSFWGAFAIGAVTGGIIGATTSGNNGDTYVENNYYIVEQGTPGYTLLADYQLTQTRCDDINNLVVINGPENSRICAFPNDIVPVGFYSIDLDTLSLVAE